MIATSGNQYLRSEYLSPIQGSSVELDAKKSPLALLAQTCSQIGSDASGKGTATAEKPNRNKLSPLNKSPGSSSEEDSIKSSSFKPYENGDIDKIDRSSPINIVDNRNTNNHSTNDTRSISRSSENGRISSKSLDLSNSTATAPVLKSSSPSDFKLIGPTSHSLASLGDLSKDPLSAYKLNTSLYPSLGLGLDHLATASLSALTAKVSSASAATNQSISNPYIGYARVKTVSGTEVVVPVCRDPYCAGCQINTHALQVINEACPPGCSHCTQLAAHAKALSVLPSSLIPNIPASSLNGLYSASSALLASSQVCNWISGDSYCGKRYSSPEELLQHLRTHTGISETPSLNIPSLHHPLLSHPALQRGYPTPPLSPLSAARYHPYAKSPLGHLTHSSLSAASLSALAAPHPLSAYYNPYSIYARSLSASAGLHP